MRGQKPDFGLDVVDDHVVGFVAGLELQANICKVVLLRLAALLALFSRICQLSLFHVHYAFHIHKHLSLVCHLA